MAESKLGNAKDFKAKKLTGSGLKSGLKLSNPKIGALTASGARGIKRRT